ncbi:hypothetical protein PsorP6_001660 [Peronosclerospora sorghi]|uniref:Uncharacterized protein n=1 Tax=Peronosclerospora sorghi TaxID=230839 RepID=A0ACC0WS86_9STRA|nr:hypothetical protein PsorP6_001660 [Peronosclerospora sorghi]
MQQNVTSYTGQSGVGLLLTPSVPLHTHHDVTKEYVSTPDILICYLVVQGKNDTVDTYIHVVYAPAQPSKRKKIPLLYSVILTTIHNILLWATFNTVLSRHLDQYRSEGRSRAQGREELL